MNEFSPFARFGSLMASFAVVMMISWPVLEKAASIMV